MILRQLNL